jgi:hypothetical protein
MAITIQMMKHIDKAVAKRLGNKTAISGVHRCYCGAKYWENDVCISCGDAHRPEEYHGEGKDFARKDEN